MKTSELTRFALDWAVAQAEGVPVSLNGTLFDDKPLERDPWMAQHYPDNLCVYRTDEDEQMDEDGYEHFCTYNRPVYDPSSDWAIGGPIIEREWIEIVPWPNESDENLRWRATQHDVPGVLSVTGPTPLIAAMRCYVASKLGDEVEVPEALK